MPDLRPGDTWSPEFLPALLGKRRLPDPHILDIFVVSEERQAIAMLLDLR
jgi:hypothetical protein